MLPISSDLALIPDLIVARLIACPDLAALTTPPPGFPLLDQDGSPILDESGEPVLSSEPSISAVVGMNRGDLLSAIQTAFSRLSVCVVVLVEEAVVLNRGTKEVVYDPVKILIEITELVELNQCTPASDPPGTGTGLQAWDIADRVCASLQAYPLAGLASPYRLFIREPGIRNATTMEDAEAGNKVLRIGLETKADSAARQS